MVPYLHTSLQASEILPNETNLRGINVVNTGARTADEQAWNHGSANFISRGQNVPGAQTAGNIWIQILDHICVLIGLFFY